MALSIGEVGGEGGCAEPWEGLAVPGANWGKGRQKGTAIRKGFCCERGPPEVEVLPTLAEERGGVRAGVVGRAQL